MTSLYSHGIQSVRSLIGGNRTGRAGLGRANNEPDQNRAGLKLARFFPVKILIAQPVLKTGSVGLNSLFKAKKNSGESNRIGPII